MLHPTNLFRSSWVGRLTIILLALISLAGNGIAQVRAARRMPQRLPTVSRNEATTANQAAPEPTAPSASSKARLSAETVKATPAKTTPVKTVSHATAPVLERNDDSFANSIASMRKLDASGPVPTETRSSGPAPTKWLRSSTASAATEVAKRLILQATREYNVGAWLSAETTTWDALRHASEGVDLRYRETGVPVAAEDSALASLHRARQAIREARDFSGIYGDLDSEAISRMARSHQTDTLDNQSTNGMTATDASDLYLDQARVALAPIASQSVEAAQAMDLLAAIYLSRADARTLPSATALCLRRAALQGQPENASLALRLGMHLADVGLVDEARWALEHSLNLEANPAAAEALAQVLRRSGHREEAAQVIATVRRQTSPQMLAVGTNERPRIPHITELSPQDFAALSKPVMSPTRRSNSVNATLASRAADSVPVTTAQQTIGNQEPSDVADLKINREGEKPGMVRRIVNSLKRVW